jgi:hypothetical protein
LHDDVNFILLDINAKGGSTASLRVDSVHILEFVFPKKFKFGSLQVTALHRNFGFIPLVFCEKIQLVSELIDFEGSDSS